MVHNHKASGRALSVPAGLAIGTCISLGTTLILSVLLAKLISTETLELEKSGYGILLILLFTSVIGAKSTCMMIKRRKLMSCVIAGLLYWLGLLTITALFFGGQYSGVGTTGVIIVCGSMIVFLQELKGEKGRSGALRKSKMRKQYP